MGVVGAVWSYAVQLGRGFWRILQSLAALNNNLIPVLFRWVSQACQAVYMLTSLLCTSLAEILVYILNVIVEALRFVVVIGEVCGKLLVAVVNILLSVYHIVEAIAGYVADVVVFSVCEIGSLCSDVVDRLGLSCGCMWKWMRTSIGTVFDSLSCGAQNIQEYTVYSVTAAHNCTVYATQASVAFVAKCTCSIYHELGSVIECISSELVRLWNSVLTFIHENIPGLNSLSPDLYLSLAVTIGTIFFVHIFIIIMRKKGLTVPFFNYSYTRNRDVLLRYVPHGDANFVISDEEDETDIGETTSSSDSDEDNRSVHSHTTVVDDDGDMEISSEDGTEEDSTSVGDEFGVNEDSDFESGDENDQNAINIQLPARHGPYDLRQRVTPARSISKLSPGELEDRLETERDKRLCVVCQDAQKNVLVLPCRHMCMCINCAHQIAAAGNPTRRVCPLCRSNIDTVMNVYL